MKTFSRFAALLILSAAFSLSAVEVQQTGQSSGGDTFQEWIQELCVFVRSNTPEGKNILSPELFRKMEPDLLKAWIPGIVPEGEYHPAAVPELSGKRQFSLRLLKNGSLLYLRIDRAKLFPEEKCISFLKGKKPSGLILDLRNCAETEYEQLDRVYGTLVGNGLPAAVLISPATARAGEILAHRLAASRQGILMGKRTAGCPFVMKKAVFRGRIFRIPVRPAGTEKLPAGPCIPSVAGDPLPLPDLSVQRTEKDLYQLDPLLRQAADLMSVLCNLQKK